MNDYIGDNGDNTLSLGADGTSAYGYGGNDIITGGVNADSLYGGSGNDTIDGGDGDDLIDGGESLAGGEVDEDVIFGGAGRDSIRGGGGGSGISGGFGGDLLMGDDSASQHQGDDTINGDAGADTIFGYAGNDLLDGGDDNDSLDGGLGDDSIMGGAGDDNVLGAAGHDAIDGGAGADNLDGGAGDDTITGGDGSDSVYGGAGADNITGGAGADRIFGGLGGDTIDGGDGDDLIDGGESLAGGEADPDIIFGGAGNDTLRGSGGNSAISGGFGGDLLMGDDSASQNQGADTLAGDAGADTIFGYAGNDLLDGGADNDSLDGGLGDDSIAGGTGDDYVLGAAGDDAIVGGLGADVLYAGAGDDSVAGGDDNDAIYGGAGDDNLYGGAGADSIYGNDGADTIEGGDGDDFIEGGESLSGGEADDEMIFGGGGSDTINTHGGHDSVDGGQGDDSLSGGAGNDNLQGGLGNDSLDGGLGDDVLTGGAGSDVITGGAGNDLFTHLLSENAGAADVYDGGADFDQLHLSVTAAEWANPVFQTDIAGLLAHINSGSAAPFVFASTGLTVSNIEKLSIEVDGVQKDPVNEQVAANTDTMDTHEDGPAVAVNLLGNDVVPDRAASVTLLTPSAYGTVTISTDLLATPQTAVATFTPGAAAQALLDGDLVTETLIYQVVDADGNIGTATLKITITGANDAASISGLSVGAIDENPSAAAPTPPPLFGTQIPQMSGVLTVEDVDNGQSAFQTPNDLTGTYGSFTFDTATGEWTYTPNEGSIELESLAEGVEVTDQMTVVSMDGTASRTVVVTITGTNDAPTLAAGVMAAVEDGPSVTLNLATLGDDIDTDNVAGDLTYTIFEPPAVGTASISGTTLTYSAGTAFQHLAQGETATVEIEVMATDAHGAQAMTVMTVTVTGTNDAPTLTAGVMNVVEDGPAVTLNLATLGDDIDSDNSGGDLTYTLANTPAFGTASISGTTLTYNPGTAFQNLAAGQTTVVAVSVIATDKHGVSTPTTVNVTVTGTNDAPTLTAGVMNVVEDGPAVTLNLATLGDDIDSDNSGGDLTYTLANTPAFGTASISGTTLTYNPGTAFQNLAAGQTTVVAVSVIATDKHGVSTPTTVNVTVTGTNDAPTLTAGVMNVVEDGPAVTLNLATLGDDIDSDNSGGDLTYTLANTPAFGTASISGTTLTYNPGTAFQNLAAGQTTVVAVSVIATDKHGVSTPTTVNVTVTGTNDRPRIIPGYADPEVTPLSDGGYTITGSFNVTDADWLNSHTLSATGMPDVTYTLIPPATNGGQSVVHWSVDVPAGSDMLGTERNINFTISDASGASDSMAMALFIPGDTNNIADVSAPMEIFTYVNEGRFEFNVNDYFYDPDEDLLIASADPNENYFETVYFQSSDGSGLPDNEIIVINPDSGAFQYLTYGQYETFNFTFLLSDGRQSQQATIQWTLEGMRDGLFGDTEANELIGGDYSEVITGYEGDDTLTSGGLGDYDVFAFFDIGEGVDVITDFISYDDRIGVSAAGFGGNLVAGDYFTEVLVGENHAEMESLYTDGVFIFETDGTDGTLYWDVDGGSGENAVAFARLNGVNYLSSDDFFIFI